MGGAGKRHHRRRAEKPDIDAGRAESRRVGADGQIACGDQLATGGGGKAIDFGDHRLGVVDDGQHEVCAECERLLEKGGALVIVGAMAVEFLEVMTGAEDASRLCRGQHDDAHIVIGSRRVDLGLECGHHGYGQSIGRRPVHGQPQYASVAFTKHPSALVGVVSRKYLFHSPLPAC